MDLMKMGDLAEREPYYLVKTIDNKSSCSSEDDDDKNLNIGDKEE